MDCLTSDWTHLGHITGHTWDISLVTPGTYHWSHLGYLADKNGFSVNDMSVMEKARNLFILLLASTENRTLDADVINNGSIMTASGFIMGMS